MFNQVLKNTKKIWFLPCMFMLFLIMTHGIFHHYIGFLGKKMAFVPNLALTEQCIYLIFLGLCEFWLISRIIDKIGNYLPRTGFFQQNATISIILPFFISVLKILAFLVLFNIITQKLTLPSNLAYLFNKSSSILIICAISGLLFKVVGIAEQLLLKHYSAELKGVVFERKIYTQTLILKRVACAIIAILAVGAILMLFDNVRALGASVLTTAGVIGLVLTFTAQRSLGSIFSGLEIALIQPIKMGDKVQIENKEGVVKEINFRNVVLKLGDWSHLIVPTSYFLDKPFQNWNRVEKTNLLGSAHLYVDYTAPVSKIRGKLQSVLQQCHLWDNNIGRLQVSDLQERTMQLKVLASARNGDDLADLLAHIREELVHFLVENYPHALPKARSSAAKDSTKEKSLIEDELGLIDN